MANGRTLFSIKSIVTAKEPGKSMIYQYWYNINGNLRQLGGINDIPLEDSIRNGRNNMYHGIKHKGWKTSKTAFNAISKKWNEFMKLNGMEGMKGIQ